MTLESKLAKSCVAFQRAELPAEARAAAVRVIRDWLGCAIVGAEMAPARAIASAFREEFGRGCATCFVGPDVCEPQVAALISGVASHSAELDDIYSPALYHPGVCVISAALAACQSVGARGDRLLRAVIAGYEISNRLGTAINPAHYEYWHTTGTVGTIGAAIAASVALGLDETQSGWAMAHATSMAAGLQQAFRSDGMTKPLHAGRAAEGGLLAARLAKAGLTGGSAMISGPAGFVRAMSHGTDISSAFDDLFHDWTIARTTFKRFSACGHVFAAVDAILELMPIALKDIVGVEIATYAKAIEVAGIRTPTSAFEAKFSIPCCVAAALLGHDLMNPTLYDRIFEDTAVRELSQRVTLVGDDEITRAYPRLRGARITIRLAHEPARAQFMKTRKGDPENPLTDRELEAKFERLVGGDRRAALLRWVDDLARDGSLDVPLR